MGKLSHVLLDLGFFSALGTSEHPRTVREECHVKRGQPLSHDYNNGILVVYDEEGRPWIMHHSKTNTEVEKGLRPFGLTRGAYVPHSNDGGVFVHEVLLKL